MSKFCSHCGKELKEGADICLNCGVFVDKKEEPIQQNGIQSPKKKIPGNGLSIAGMVLGIIAAVWAFFELVGVGEIPSSLSEIAYTASYYSDLTFLYFGFGFGYTLFSLIPSIIGLPLSIAGMKKYKSGKNLAGLILNIIALAISIIMIIYILSLA